MFSENVFYNFEWILTKDKIKNLLYFFSPQMDPDQAVK